MRTMTLEEKRESLNNVLDSINELDDIVLESDADVLLSMGMTYNKASVILENYEYYDYDEIFAIFQEEDTTATQSSEPTANSDMNAKAAETNQNAKSGFIAFFVNIFKKIVQFFKDAWNGRIAPAFETVANKIKGTKPIEEEKVPLWKAIFSKPIEWISEHKKELGIGGAAIAGIFGFKAVLALLDDDNKIKQPIVKLLDAIGIPFEATKVIFKATVCKNPNTGNNEVGILSNIKLTGDRIKYILTEGIPKFLKAELALLKNIKNIVTSHNNLDESEEYKNAVNSLNDLLSKEENAKIIDKDMTVEQAQAELEKDGASAEKVATLNQFISLKENIDKVSTDLDNSYKEIKTIIGGDDENSQKKFLSNIRDSVDKNVMDKYKKAEDGLGKTLAKATIIGGIVSKIINAFGFIIQAIGKLLKGKNETEAIITNNGASGDTVTEDPGEELYNGSYYYYDENGKETPAQQGMKFEPNKFFKKTTEQAADTNTNNNPVPEESTDANAKIEELITAAGGWDAIKNDATDDIMKKLSNKMKEEPKKYTDIPLETIEEYIENKKNPTSEEDKTEEEVVEPAAEPENPAPEKTEEKPEITGVKAANAIHKKIVDEYPDFKSYDLDQRKNIVEKIAKEVNAKVTDYSYYKDNFGSIFTEYFFDFDDDDDIISESWYNKF